ncbi:hypothetical protein C8J57DRAFT_1253133 [Mycena rebaudengoi]|nr:hypothetical protein C8J57DRAFT_1253133 [Mycena rebaudengoi]
MPRRSSCQRRAHAILITLNGLIRAVGGFTQGLPVYLTNVKYSRSSEFWGQKDDMPRLAPIRKKWLGAGPSGARSILTNQNLMGCSWTAHAVGVSPVCSLAATPEFEFQVAGDFFMAAWAAGCCTSTSLMGARIVGITRLFGGRLRESGPESIFITGLPNIPAVVDNSDPKSVLKGAGKPRLDLWQQEQTSFIFRTKMMEAMWSDVMPDGGTV